MRFTLKQYHREQMTLGCPVDVTWIIKQQPKLNAANAHLYIQPAHKEIRNEIKLSSYFCFVLHS